LNPLINPYTVVSAFILILLALAIFKPQAARIVSGVFFLVMGLGVNLAVLLIDPALFVAAGENALLPVYRWFFTQVLASAPVPFAILLILFETVVGVLILSKGRWVKLGLAGGIAFSLWITFAGTMMLTSPGFAIVFGLLLRHTFDRSLLDMIGSVFRRGPVKINSLKSLTE